MAATISTRYYIGDPKNEYTLTNMRFKLVDDNIQIASNPCKVPTAGTNYSFWKSIVFYADTVPSTAINNIKLYTDGGLPWTGCTLYVGNETPVEGDYEQATGSADSGDEMVAYHGAITGKTDLFNYTRASPKSVSGTITGADEESDLVILQVAINTSALAGYMPQETFTWRYDET